jgi:hypothetical protein
MSTVPFLIPVTSPLLSTVAILSSEDFHVRAALCPAGSNVTINGADSPFCTDDVFGNVIAVNPPAGSTGSSPPQDEKENIANAAAAANDKNLFVSIVIKLFISEN